MATRKTHKVKTGKPQKRKNNNKKYFRIGNFKIKKKTAIIILSILGGVILFALFRNSHLWPWPSQSEVDQRLSDVIDACMYNENSRACKNLTNKYNMEFEYCHALSDVPEIGVSIPIYGVAKKKSFSASPINHESTTKSGSDAGSSLLPMSGGSLVKNSAQAESTEKGDSIYPYYGCSDSLDEITRLKGPNLISEPDTMALYGLSQIPQYSETYEPQGQYGCMFHKPGFNNLWKQIPNISAIKNEGDNIFNMYPKCNMRADIDRSINDINTKISSYANSYPVQLFYQKYDEWNTRGFLSGCTWYDKSFKQRCGAGSDGSKESAGYGSMVSDFINDMRQYLHTDYFSSKIVVSN